MPVPQPSSTRRSTTTTRSRYVGTSRCSNLRKKLLAHATFQLNMSKSIAEHYYKHVHKVRTYNSRFTGYMWVRDVLGAKIDTRCVNAFRMERHVFRQLCSDLKNKYGLEASEKITIEEKVAIFVYTLAQGTSYRTTQERFQRSSSTIHDAMHQVLEAIVGRNSPGKPNLSRDMIKPRDSTFAGIPSQVSNDSRYSPYFNAAIGCIDGTHISANIDEKDQVPFRGRKGVCTYNVMAVCDFNLQFTFIFAGWEGSAHDARVFNHTVSTPELGFPHPPPGKYYLVDKGYPDKERYMVPFGKQRYHRLQFEDVAPESAKELFNKQHSSLRGHIERCFGILKSMWRILVSMPKYFVRDQVDIIISCFALHNYIMMSKEVPRPKPAFVANDLNDDGNSEYDDDEGPIIPNPEDLVEDSCSESESESDDEDEGNDEFGFMQPRTHVMRDHIASAMMENRSHFRRM